MNMSTEYEKVDTTGKMSYEKIMKAERSADIFRHLYLISDHKLEDRLEEKYSDNIN